MDKHFSPPQAKPLVVANCSGFYGDRLSAAKEMVTGGPIDVLTGDYLAELTMAILYRKKMKNPSEGFANTFLAQMEEVMGECLSRGIKVVVNAGGLNPQGLAQALEDTARRLGLSPRIASIDGDDLMGRLQELQEAGEAFLHLERGTPLKDSGTMPVTANVYLGAWGIREALAKGADIVVTGRVADASLAVGPAAWKFGWKRDDFDCLAGAVAAGHILECGCQATGGNYAFFQEVPNFRQVGFPLAEIYPDGSSVITKHPGTGGLVSVGTVTAQILYEISSPAYLNPDVTAHFDTLTLEEIGPDRVAVFGARGSSPPSTHKVCINTLDGYRTGVSLLLAGLDVEEKAKIFLDAFFDVLGGKEKFERLETQLIRSDKENPPSNEEAFATLRINARSPDEKLVGRRFSSAMIELGLANVPGFGVAAPPPREAMPVLVYWPALISSQKVREVVRLGEEAQELLPTSLAVSLQDAPKPMAPESSQKDTASFSGPWVQVPLGRIFAARSGDKGGCANLGVWGKDALAYAFLESFLTEEKLKALLPDVAPYPIKRYTLANLFAVNFYIEGILGDGVSSSFRMDPQAKTLGEYLRAKIIEAPLDIVLEPWRSALKEKAQ